MMLRMKHRPRQMLLISLILNKGKQVSLARKKIMRNSKVLEGKNGQNLLHHAMCVKKLGMFLIIVGTVLITKRKPMQQKSSTRHNYHCGE